MVINHAAFSPDGKTLATALVIWGLMYVIIMIYDCEIINTPDQNPPAGIKKCGGWRDFSNMGISVICAYDYLKAGYRLIIFGADGQSRGLQSRWQDAGYRLIFWNNLWL